MPVAPDESAHFSPLRREDELAPPWHTAALILLILGVATTGVMMGHRGTPISVPSPAGSRIATVYLPVLLMQWGLAAYVARVGRPRNAIPILLGKRWDSVRRATVDIGLAVLVGTFIVASELSWAHFQGAGRNAAVGALLPDTDVERAVWGLVATSVGFCEEVVYRGYLQTQLSAFTRSTTLASVLQATLFGIAHAEQGLAPAVRFAVYGIALTALVRTRRSLLPAIVCHVGIDLLAGFVGG